MALNGARAVSGKAGESVGDDQLAEACAVADGELERDEGAEAVCRTPRVSRGNSSASITRAT